MQVELIDVINESMKLAEEMSKGSEYDKMRTIADLLKDKYEAKAALADKDAIIADYLRQIRSFETEAEMIKCRNDL